MNSWRTYSPPPLTLCALYTFSSYPHTSFNTHTPHAGRSRDTPAARAGSGSGAMDSTTPPAPGLSQTLDLFLRILRSRQPEPRVTRPTCVSTGNAGLLKQKSSTINAVLWPMPSNEVSRRVASSTDRSARKSMLNSPRSSRIRRSARWIRGAFCCASPPERMASARSSTGASSRPARWDNAPSAPRTPGRS